MLMVVSVFIVCGEPNNDALFTLEKHYCLDQQVINQSLTTCVCLLLNPKIFIALIDTINT